MWRGVGISLWVLFLGAPSALPSSVQPAAPAPPALVGQRGGATRAVAAGDGLVLVGEGPRLRVLRRCPGLQPAEIGATGVLPDLVRDVWLAPGAGEAWLALGMRGLARVDLANPADPRADEPLPLPEALPGVPAEALRLAYDAADRRLWVAGTAGLHVFDLSAGRPRLLAALASPEPEGLPSQAHDLAIQGELVAVAWGVHGLRVYERAPMPPVPLGALPAAEGAVEAVALAGETAWLLDGPLLREADLRDPGAPRASREAALAEDGLARGLALHVRGEQLFVAYAQGFEAWLHLQVYDTSDERLAPYGESDLGGIFASSPLLPVSGRSAAFAADGDGLHLVADLLGRLPLPLDGDGRLEQAALASWDGQATTLLPLVVDDDASGRAWAAGEDRLAALSMRGRPEVFTPADPDWIGGLAWTPGIFGLGALGEQGLRAVVGRAAEGGSLHVAERTPQGTPLRPLLDGLGTGPLAAEGEIAVLAAGAELRLVRVAEDATARRMPDLALPGGGWATDVDLILRPGGPRLAVVDGQRLHVADLDEGGAAAWLPPAEVPGGAQKVALAGERAWVVGFAGLRGYDLVGEAPRLAARVDLEGAADVAATEARVWVASWSEGGRLHAFEVEGDALAAAPALPLPAAPQAIVARGERALIAGGAAGLLLVDAAPGPVPVPTAVPPPGACPAPPGRAWLPALGAGASPSP